MRQMRFTSLLLMSLLLVGCIEAQRPPTPQRTQLEIREQQTREYPTTDVKMVMKAVLNVLQDDGFIVKNAVTDLGLITATKELGVERTSQGGDSSVFMGMGGRWHRNGGFGFGFPGGDWGSPPQQATSQHTVIEASANVTTIRDTTRVRVNFQEKVIDNLGGTVSVRQTEDPYYYRDFFTKVDKGIFIEKQRL